MNVNRDDFFVIDLGALLSGESQLSIEHFTATLETTTTILMLDIVDKKPSFYDPTPDNNRRFFEPLCQCIANLRHSNNDHPLEYIYLAACLDNDAMEQFLIAAKQFGIRRLVIKYALYLSVHILEDFCRNNNNLDNLEQREVSFCDEVGAGSFGPSTNHGMVDPPVMVSLVMLALYNIEFDNSTAATNFANLVARMSVSELELGGLLCTADADDAAHDEDDDENDDNDDNDEDENNNDDEDEVDEIELAKSILSRMQFPTAEKLILARGCHLEHFKAALEAGKGTMIQLDVAINCDEVEAREKKNLLAIFLRGAVVLTSLTIRLSSDLRNWQPPVLFFAKALDTCATVTHATTSDDDSPDPIDINNLEQLELQRITTRNVELGRFVANPSTYPTEHLLILMRLFDNCPSGLYTLSRHLPVVFSFDKLRTLMIEKKKKKKRKADEMEAAIPELMLEITQLHEQISQVTSELGRATKRLHALIQQQQEERAPLTQKRTEAGGTLEEK